jgi:signal transduction histidine kinase
MTTSEKLLALEAENQKLLSLISHDIKGPLNRVFALMQLLQMDGENFTTEQRDLLDKMHLVVTDGMAMLRNLVDYRNLEYKGLDIMPEPVNVTTLVNTAVQQIKSLAGKKNITLSFTAVETDDRVLDRQSLLRILDNLLSNAVKFSTPGKHVEVSIKKSAGIEISIRDQAPGFTVSDLEKLYGKFTRLSAKPTAGESATGLGLYIAKKVAERNGWVLSVQTPEGLGSIFTLQIPAY